MNVFLESWMQRNFPGQEPWPCHNVVGVGTAADFIDLVMADAGTPACIARVGFTQSLPGYPVYDETATGRGVRIEFRDEEPDYQTFLALLREYAALFGATVNESNI